jgi:predicted CoA-binding protein
MRIRRLFSVAFSTMSTGGFKNEEATIRKVLTSTKTIALVGASNKPERPSHYVMEYLLQQGYDVIPVNPGLAGKDLLGKICVGSLAEIEQPIDMVDIFRNSDAVPPIVDEAISIGAKSIWMQQGVINEAAAQTARDAGLDVIMNSCPKIEIPKLGIDGPSSQL